MVEQYYMMTGDVSLMDYYFINNVILNSKMEGTLTPSNKTCDTDEVMLNQGQWNVFVWELFQAGKQASLWQGIEYMVLSPIMYKSFHNNKKLMSSHTSADFC